MNNDSNDDIIKLLQQQIKQERENYRSALKRGKLSRELKIIQQKIASLRCALESLEYRSSSKEEDKKEIS